MQYGSFGRLRMTRGRGNKQQGSGFPRFNQGSDNEKGNGSQVQQGKQRVTKAGIPGYRFSTVWFGDYYSNPALRCFPSASLRVNCSSMTGSTISFVALSQNGNEIAASLTLLAMTVGKRSTNRLFKKLWLCNALSRGEAVR